MRISVLLFPQAQACSSPNLIYFSVLLNRAICNKVHSNNMPLVANLAFAGGSNTGHGFYVFPFSISCLPLFSNFCCPLFLSTSGPSRQALPLGSCAKHLLQHVSTFAQETMIRCQTELQQTRQYTSTNSTQLCGITAGEQKCHSICAGCKLCACISKPILRRQCHMKSILYI